MPLSAAIVVVLLAAIGGNDSNGSGTRVAAALFISVIVMSCQFKRATQTGAKF